MSYDDYYTILGLDRNASANDIKRVYRELAKKHHPDILGPNASIRERKDAEERFKRIYNAYEILYSRVQQQERERTRERTQQQERERTRERTQQQERERTRERTQQMSPFYRNINWRPKMFAIIIFLVIMGIYLAFTSYEGTTTVNKDYHIPMENDVGPTETFEETPTPTTVITTINNPTVVPTITTNIKELLSGISIVLYAGETRNFGNGYSLKVLSIENSKFPGQVRLALYKDGTMLDEKIIFAGTEYSFSQNNLMFKTRIVAILIDPNTGEKNVLFGDTTFS